MRIFNKIVVVILILVALPTGTLFLALPDVTTAALAEAFTAMAALFTAYEQPARMGLALLALALDLVLFWLLYMELRSKPTPSAKVMRIRGGQGEVMLETVQQRVHHDVSQLSDVVEVRAEVSARGGRVDVALDVVTSPHINVPKKIDEVVQVVREAVIGDMGLKLRGKPSVSIRHVAYGETPSPAPPSSPASEVTPAEPDHARRKFLLKLPKRPED